MGAKSRISVNNFFEMSSGKILGDKATLANGIHRKRKGELGKELV